MATTGGGGAGAVRVSGAPSGGVSGAAAADDVGSVIDFLSGAGFGRCVSIGKLVAIWALTSLLDGRCRDSGSDKRSRFVILPRPGVRFDACDG